MSGQVKLQYSVVSITQIVIAALLFFICAMMSNRDADGQTINPIGDRGDHQIVDKCQGAGFLVGFTVHSGDWLDQIAVICSPVSLEGKTGAPTGDPLRGGNGGAPRPNAACAVNEVAVGLIIHLTSDNRRVRGMGLDCKNALDVRTQGLGRIVNMGHTDSPGIFQLCNPGSAVVAVAINYGADVNGIGLTCGLGPKLVSNAGQPIKTTGTVTGTGVTGSAVPILPLPSVSSPGTVNQLVPGQVLGKDGCSANAKVPPVQGDMASTTAESVIECLINTERKARGLSILTVDNNLQTETVAEGVAAVTQKWWVAGASPHNNPKTGSTPDSRVKGSGFCGGTDKISSDGEIAWNGSGQANYVDDSGNATASACLNGCGSPNAAVDWWMNISPPHRALILAPGYTHIGVAAFGDVANPKNAGDPAKGLYIVDFGSCH